MLSRGNRLYGLYRARSCPARHSTQAGVVRNQCIDPALLQLLPALAFIHRPDMDRVPVLVEMAHQCRIDPPVLRMTGIGGN